MREVSYYILYLLLLYKCVSQNLLLALSAGWDQEETALSDQHFSTEDVKSTLLRLTNRGLIKKYIIVYELIGERKEEVTQWTTKEKVYLCKKRHRNTDAGSTVCYVITAQGIRSLLANAGDNNLLNAISALSGGSRILVSNWTKPEKIPLMLKDGDAAALCFLADVICSQHKRIPIIRPNSSSEKERKEEKISKGGGQNISWLLSTATAQIMSQEELPDKGSPMFYKRSEITWAETRGQDYWIYKLNGLLSTADGLYPIIVTDGYGGTDITKTWGSTTMNRCDNANYQIGNNLDHSDYAILVFYRTEKELFDVLYTSALEPVGDEVTKFFKWRKTGSNYDLMVRPFSHIFGIPISQEGIWMMRALTEVNFVREPISTVYMKLYLQAHPKARIETGEADRLNIFLREQINRNVSQTPRIISEILVLESGWKVPVIHCAENDIQKMNYFLFITKPLGRSRKRPLTEMLRSINESWNDAEPEAAIICKRWQKKYWEKIANNTRILFITE